MTEKEAVAQRMRAARRALNRGIWDDILTASAPFLTAPNGLRQLGGLFVKAQKLDLFFDLIWQQRHAALCRLASVADVMKLFDADDARAQKIVTWLLSTEAPPVKIAYNNHISRLKLGAEHVPDILKIKYKGWDFRPETLADYVAAAAPRYETPEPILRMVYGRTGDGLSFPQWHERLQFAQSISHLFRDTNIAAQSSRKTDGGSSDFLFGFAKKVADAVPYFLDMQQWKSAFDDLDRSNGLLLTTLHDQYPKLTVTMFHNLVADNYHIRITELTKGHDGQLQGGNGNVAFRAVKALFAKKVVLMAADGDYLGDRARAEIDVLGEKVRVSIGAAVIAYESRCSTGWYSANIGNGAFVPVLRAGPSRAQNETFEQFRKRWLDFYAAQYEAALSASPNDLIFFLKGDAAP